MEIRPSDEVSFKQLAQLHGPFRGVKWYNIAKKNIWSCSCRYSGRLTFRNQLKLSIFR